MSNTAARSICSRIWNDLKAAGPLALVEVEDQGETVKIWLE